MLYCMAQLLVLVCQGKLSHVAQRRQGTVRFKTVAGGQQNREALLESKTHRRVNRRQVCIDVMSGHVYTTHNSLSWCALSKIRFKKQGFQQQVPCTSTQNLLLLQTRQGMQNLLEEHGIDETE